jgi:hypothetical protein
MAVDYFHRVLVAGKREDVRAFRDRIYREYPRTVGGETWTEIVPFSFAALYDLAPAARKIESEIPFDPYDLSAWPIRTLPEQRAEIRYQLHTRNLELVDFLRPLARALPRLTFTLTTLCLDDSSIEAYRLRGRRELKWVILDRRRDFHWDRARRKFKLVGDEVYDDDEAHRWAEEEMLTEAFSHWDETGRVRRDQAPRRYRWWNAIPLRDLDTERKLSLLAMGLVLEQESGASKRRPPKRRAKTRNPLRRPRGAASRHRSPPRRKRHS